MKRPAQDDLLLKTRFLLDSSQSEREILLKMKLDELRNLLDSLKLLKSHPGLFIADYFKTWRHEIDLTAEMHLEALEGEPDQVATKSQEINSIRQWMLQELNEREQALNRVESPCSNQQLDHDLDERVETLSRHLDPSSEHFKELYKKTAIDVQQSIMQAQAEIMQHQTVYFYSTSERVGKLFIFKGVFVEDECFSRYGSMFHLVDNLVNLHLLEF